MDNPWSDDTLWNAMLEEEFLTPFQPSKDLTELEPLLPTFPSSWLDNELGYFENATCLDDIEQNFTWPSLVDQSYHTYDEWPIQDLVTTIEFRQEPASQPTAEVPQVLITPLNPQPFTEHLHEFQGVSGQISQRKRKRFSPRRRKEVGNLRKVGACIRCRLTKSSCKLDHPCSACTKLCGNNMLGKIICIRQRLLDVRFASDLWHRTSDLEWLRDEIAPLEASRQTLTVFLYNCHLDASGAADDFTHKRDPADRYTGIPFPWKKTIGLQLMVQKFSPRDEGEHCLTLHDQDSFEIRSIPGEYYAIAGDALPTLEELEAWAMETVTTLHSVGFLGGLRASFLYFARRYSECEADLPLPRRFVSQAVHTQLAVIVTNRIAELERDILSALQELLFNTKGPGRPNMLPIWTILWLLILTYRKTVHCWYTEKPKKASLPELAGQMYNMLVSIYSALFRPSSPMSRNWLMDRDLFGEGTELIVAMGTVQTEFHLFHKYGEHRHPKDELLRSLVFEREIELLRKTKEAAKRPHDHLREKHYSSLISPATPSHCFYSFYEVNNSPYV